MGPLIGRSDASTKYARLFSSRGELRMGFHGLNVWAVLAAAVSAFVLGGLWYAPFLFGKAWKGANGFGSEEPLTAGAKVFVISFVLSLIIGVNLAISEDGRGVGRDGWISFGIWLGRDGNWDRVAI